MWHLFKIKFEGPKNKTIREQHLLNVDDPGAGTELLKRILKPRVREFTITSVALAEFAHIATYAGTAGIETTIAYPFHVVTLDMWDHKDKYLIPANGHEQATERALADSNMDDDRIFDYKETAITGVWDNLSDFWKNDWRNRMDVREARHFHSPKEEQVEKGEVSKKQSSIFDVDTETGEVFGKPASAPPVETLTETEEQRIARELAERKTNVPAIRNVGVGPVETLAVEAEDMENGVEPEHFHEARLIETPQLGPGTDINANSEQKYPAGKTKAKAKPKKEVKPKTPKRAAKRRGDWVSPTA